MEMSIAKNIAKTVAKRTSCSVAGSCMYFAEEFCAEAKRLGYDDFIVVEGYIEIEGIEDNAELQHTWIETNSGDIIDETKRQFGDGEIYYLKEGRKEYSRDQYLELSEKSPIDNNRKSIYMKESKQVGIIYHFTTFGALRKLNQYDFKMKLTSDGISFTRNYRLPETNDKDFENKIVRISIDGNKLSEKYKIEPYCFTANTFSDEEEKFKRTRAYDVGCPYEFKRYGEEAEEKIWLGQNTHAHGQVDILNSILAIDIDMNSYMYEAKTYGNAEEVAFLEEYANETISDVRDNTKVKFPVRIRTDNKWMPYKLMKESKQVGVIYHFTPVYTLFTILDEMKIKSPNYKYISFTRDFQFQKRRSGIFYNFICRIALDGNVLSEQYKIRPFNFFKTEHGLNQSRYDEMEESIVAEEVDISKALLDVSILADWKNTWIDLNDMSEKDVEFFLSKTNAYELVDELDDDTEKLEYLERMKANEGLSKEELYKANLLIMKELYEKKIEKKIKQYHINMVSDWKPYKGIKENTMSKEKITEIISLMIEAKKAGLKEQYEELKAILENVGIASVMTQAGTPVADTAGAMMPLMPVGMNAKPKSKSAKKISKMKLKAPKQVRKDYSDHYNWKDYQKYMEKIELPKIIRDLDNASYQPAFFVTAVTGYDIQTITQDFGILDRLDSAGIRKTPIVKDYAYDLYQVIDFIKKEYIRPMNESAFMNADFFKILKQLKEVGSSVSEAIQDLTYLFSDEHDPLWIKKAVREFYNSGNKPQQIAEGFSAKQEDRIHKLLLKKDRLEKLRNAEIKELESMNQDEPDAVEVAEVYEQTILDFDSQIQEIEDELNDIEYTEDQDED